MKGLLTTHIQYPLQGSGFIALNPKPQPHYPTTDESSPSSSCAVDAAAAALLSTSKGGCEEASASASAVVAEVLRGAGRARNFASSSPAKRTMITISSVQLLAVAQVAAADVVFELVMDSSDPGLLRRAGLLHQE